MDYEMKGLLAIIICMTGLFALAAYMIYDFKKTETAKQKEKKS